MKGKQRRPLVIVSQSASVDRSSVGMKGVEHEMSIQELRSLNERVQCEMKVGMFFDGEMCPADRERMLERVESCSAPVVEELEQLHLVRESLRSWCEAECSNVLPQLALWERLESQLEVDCVTARRRLRSWLRSKLGVSGASKSWLQPALGFAAAGVVAVVLVSRSGSPTQLASNAPDRLQQAETSSGAIAREQGPLLVDENPKTQSDQQGDFPAAAAAPVQEPSPSQSMAQEPQLPVITVAHGGRPFRMGDEIDSFEYVARELTRGRERPLEDRVGDLVAFESISPMLYSSFPQQSLDAQLHYVNQ